MISCCRDCPDREPHCHGKCERYLKERAELDAKNESIKKQNIVEDYFQTTTRHAIDNFARGQLKRKRFERWHED